MSQKSITTTYIPEKTLKRAKIYAVKNDTSVSQIMTEALRHYIESNGGKKCQATR